MRTFKFEIHGKTGGGNTYTTTGIVNGDFALDYPGMISSAMRQSFQQLTGGGAVFGHPGHGGCQGPYSLTHLFLSDAAEELPFNLQTPGRISSVDSLRLAARALQMAANDVEATQTRPDNSGKIKQVLASIRTIPELLIAVASTIERHAASAQEDHPALSAARLMDPVTGAAVPAYDPYKLQAIPPGATEGDSTMSNVHQPHHHHKTAQDTQEAAQKGDTPQTGGSSTVGDSTNAPADQVGMQAAADYESGTSDTATERAAPAPVSEQNADQAASDTEKASGAGK